MQVRPVVVGRPARQEEQPRPEPVGVRHRSGEDATGSQHACDLGDDVVGEPHVLQQLAGDDGVEVGVGERQRLLDVREHRLDAE